MVLRVADIAAQAVGRAHTYVATDDERIAQVVRTGGYKAILTSPNAKTGTDRVAEASDQIQADIYVNVQGDEPLLNPDDISRVIDSKVNNYEKVVNAMAPLGKGDDPNSPGIPKVVASTTGKLLYMSRLPIPGLKNNQGPRPLHLKQVCIYAFSRTELSLFRSYGDQIGVEKYEDIEILRFLEIGYEVKMVEVSSGSIAVDYPSDVSRVESLLNSMKNHT